MGNQLKMVYVAYLRTPTFIGICMILDMCMLTQMLIFTYGFLKFSIFFWFLQFYIV